MANLSHSFSSASAARREMPQPYFWAASANCSASCSACSRSPAPTAREEHIATLSLLAGDYMELVWNAAMENNAEDFRFWRNEVRRTDMEICALRSEAVCA